MWIIYAVAAALFLVLIFLSRKEKVESDGDMEVMKRWFLKPASWLERKLPGSGKMQKRNKTSGEARLQTELMLLYPSESGARRRRFTVEKLSSLLFILFLGFLLSALLYMADSLNQRLTPDGRVFRNSYGEGSVSLRLEADMGEGKDNFVIEVDERKYTGAELEEMVSAAEQILEQEIAGENESLDEIRQELYLPGKIEGLPFEIHWESGNYSLIQTDGQVTNAQVGEQGELVEITAVLTYFDREWQQVYTVRVCPPIFTEEEKRQNRLLDEIAKSDREAACEEAFLLPTSAGGANIVWSQKEESGSLWILFLFLLAAGAQLYFADEELRKKLETRDRQLLLAYPEFVSKLTLLMGAGLPVRAAFARMASDYCQGKGRREKSYVYEEILLACREMESGITETEAYEHFGSRCRLPQYRKCASLLVQNLKKGSRGMLEAMQEEAERSYEERKRNAREEGEKAGTKLLLPMIMMLAVVMVLIMVPACFSFVGM